MQRNRDHPSRGLAVDIISSIDDNAMCDVMLLAIDGGEIPASRFVLGARSPVLQQVLFHKSSRASSELKLPYSTAVISTLVHYCRTNELGSTCQSSRDEASTRELVHLCQCAVAFQLGGLETLVGDLASSICQVDPHLACALYDETVVCGGKAVKSLKHIALSTLRTNPQVALLRKKELASRRAPGGVSYLKAASLEEILSDTKLCTEEIILFRAVILWADASSIVDDKLQRNVDTWATQLMLQDRREEAKKIVAKCIDLSKTAPSELMGVVSDSGLVDEVDVSNALIQLALRIEKEGVEVSKRRDGGKPKERPPPPPHTVYCIEKEPISGAEILGQAGADASGSSLSYEHVEQDSNKRKLKKQYPKTVTPEKEPAFATPELSTREPYLISEAHASESKKKPPEPSIGSEIRKKVGLFLRDKVDSMCIHPTCDTHQHE